MVAQCRIACLRIPRFPIVVHQKAEPSLKGQALVIVSGTGSGARIVLCSPAAVRANIVAGMKLSEAKAVCLSLVWRTYDELLYKDAHKKLLQALVDCSPRVTVLELGTFILDAAGLDYIGGEKGLCRNMQKIAGRMGFGKCYIGIADSAFAAHLASQSKQNQCYIVPAGQDRKFLAPLSLEYLPICDASKESLQQLGINSLGQMIDLGREALRQRFGDEGNQAYDLACGIDKRQPVLPPLEKEFQCSVDLGEPIELLNEIQFVLKFMLDKLTRELQEQGWSAQELQIAFFNGDGQFDERFVKLLQPANQSKFLLEVVKLSLETNPIAREVTGMTVCISRFVKECWQQNSVVSTATASIDKAPLSLTLMLQRFMAKLGQDAVVRSISNDQYMPEHAGAWLPVTNAANASPVVPVNVSYINARVGASGLASGLVLRKCPAPIPVLVEFQGQYPTALTYLGRWYRVKQITEPERLSGLWWESPLRKSYYIALLEARKATGEMAHNESLALSEPGLLVLLVQDHEEESWYLNGFYD